jgi:hypothetical protein
MSAIEIISGYVTAPSTTITALTMNGNDSKTIRNFDVNKKARLLNLWANNQAVGIMEMKAPAFHDNVRGLYFDVTAAAPNPLLPLEAFQHLQPQETLSWGLSGSATASDIEQAGALIYYDELPGVSARLATYEAIRPRIRNIFPVKNSITGGTSGGYSGEEAINADIDLFKANTDYALLGYIATENCGTICWRGIDTGNLRVGGPGLNALPRYTSNWFVRLNYATGLPTIPVFGSANKNAIYVDLTNDENALTQLLTSVFAELGPSST